jgi:murein DD-endopeptidase MepM/ murein hydrolase activator NlpD
LAQASSLTHDDHPTPRLIPTHNGAAMTLFYGRMALVLLAGGSLAACTTYDPMAGQLSEPLKPNFPTRMPEAAAQQAPASAAPSSARVLEPAAPPVRDTPPTVSAAPQPNYSPPPNYQPPAGSPPPAQAAPRPVAPPPVMQTVTRTSVTGRVVDAEGPAKTYTVEKGDTLYGIGRKLGVRPEELARTNGLKEPYRLQPGQKLKGPRSEAKAYVIGDGDTLYAIARRFGVSAAAIAEANEMAIDTPIRAGARLILPDGFRDAGPIQTRVQVAVPQPAPTAPVQRPAPAPAPPPPAAQPQPRPAAPPPAPTAQQQQRPPATTPAPVARPPAATPPPAQATPARPAAPVIVPTNPTPADQQISQLGRGLFIWPLRGDILSTFGPKGTGQRNDGINVRTTAGAVVRAAADGDVVYAGDQVPGFGNLVLIKHADGWVTAYGHLGRVDVKMQQKITQGQQIGQAGSTGGVPEPQLHFEVRYAPTPADRARPIDPLLVLPR